MKLLERLAEILATRKPQLGIALETARDETRQPDVYIGHSLAQLWRGAATHGLGELAGLDVGERRLARDQREQHRAERVDIGAARRRPPSPHLRRHEVGGADHRAGGVIVAFVDDPRQTEVDELRDAFVADHRVAWLDVAMHDPAPMRRRETACELDGDIDDLQPWDRERMVRKRPATHELADDVRPVVELSDAIHADDIRVLDPGGRSRLHEEALARFEVGLDARDELDRDRAREHRILGQIDAPHLATSKLGDDQIVVELLGWLPFGGCGFCGRGCQCDTGSVRVARSRLVVAM